MSERPEIRALLDEALDGEPPLAVRAAEIRTVGHRRLRQRRLLAGGGATAAVVAVLLGATALVGLRTDRSAPTITPAAPPSAPSSVAAAEDRTAGVNVVDGQVYGVAMPIEVNFRDPVPDRAAAERALSVRTDMPVEGSWAWCGPRTVHYRPQYYWPSDIQVTVTVRGGNGDSDLVVRFRIGRSQIGYTDTQTRRFTVTQGGRPVLDAPANFGVPTSKARAIRLGVHVVSDRKPDYSISSPDSNYQTFVQWAVRLSDWGEFVHADTGSKLADSSIRLLPKDARQYFEEVQIGDPVVVNGSGTPMTEQDGDYSDWNVPWQAWRSRSALPGG